MLQYYQYGNFTDDFSNLFQEPVEEEKPKKFDKSNYGEKVC